MPTARLTPITWALAAVTVLLEICYPLIHGHHRDQLTVATVVVFALATVSHLLASRAPSRALAFVVVTVLVGFTVEAVGTRTGFPFGHYAYDDSLGTRLLRVPLVIPLAWTMMSWPALCAARRLSTNRAATAAIGGWALASWDLFLDPQMVAAGHWHWAHTSPGLQGIPLTNYAGWLAVSVVLMAVLDRIVSDSGGDGQPLTLYLWTYGSSVLANLAFFDRPAVALTGGIGMGVVALPLARRLATR
ncbi:carotenoid biosynthesis protein [Acidothermaceae bacterium B102]|nr:carotenoid biosynthesis protein [Acidothermaceae bacterium B102]